VQYRMDVLRAAKLLRLGSKRWEPLASAFTSCTTMNLPRTPRPAEMGDEQPHHGNRCPTCSLMRWPLVLILGKNNGYSDMANAHCDGSQCQNRLSSKFVNIQDGGDGGEEHDNADNACGKKRGRI
jgi:hypothetical protein